MKTIFYHTGEDLLTDGRFAATIGFFDGMHLGHRFLIDELQKLARQNGLQTMAVTFEHHPRQVLQPQWQPQLLTTLKEKEALLAATGIDLLVVLRFDEQMARLTARDFMQQVLSERLQVKLLLTGYDHRFGHDRSEGFDDYVRYGRQIGMDIRQSTPFNLNGQPISSSRIRRLLNEGNVSEAADCLGHPYRLSGTVVHGKQIGRQLGFPTANIQLDDSCLLVPANGVYAVSVAIDGRNGTWQGMTNIGTRPTFEGHRQTIETNIFDFNGDIYQQHLSIALIERLRSEQHFDTPEALVRQMERDAQQAQQNNTTICTKH